MKRRMALFLTMAMCVGTLAGCGKETTDTATKTETTDTSVKTEATETTSSGAVSVTVAEIQERGKLVIGGEMNYEPYEYLDENDKYVGYDIEIWEYIANDLGVELEIVDLPFSGALTGLDAGKYDVVGCVVGINPDRAKSYEFCLPIMQTSYLAVKAASNETISSMGDAPGHSIGAQTGSSAEVRVQALAATLEEAGTPLSDVKSYSGTTDAFMDVANGGIDLAVEAGDMVDTLMKNQPGVFEVVGEVGDTSYLAYAFRLSDTEFREYVDSEIKKMKEDGTLSSLMTKYFGYDITAELPESDFIPE